MFSCHHINLHVPHAGRQWTLLNNIHIEFSPGRLHMILGPNGAGKSSLLKILSGDIRATSGQVLFQHRDLHHWSLSSLARRRAVMSQHYSLDFAFKAHEIVSMGSIAWHQRASRSEVQHIMELIDVAHLAEQHYTRLSGGEQQRVQMARVLLQVSLSTRPMTLLLDEPLSSLDIHHKHLVLGVLKNQVCQGHSLIMVEHDVNLAAQYADSVCLMDQGRIFAHGEKAAVLHAEHLSQLYQLEVIEHRQGQHPLFGFAPF